VHIIRKEGPRACQEEEEREGLRALGMRISRKAELDGSLLALGVEI
jgi:hypothetical protein